VVSRWSRTSAVSRSSGADIRAIRNGQIARFKIPRDVRFIASFSIPITGKVQKHKLRQMMVAESAQTAGAKDD